MSLELAKYMVMKWMEAEIEIHGYLLQLSDKDRQEFLHWLTEEMPKYHKIRETVKERAEWLDKHNQ